MLNTKTSPLLFFNKISKKLFKNKLIDRDKINKPQTKMDNRAYSLKTMESYSLNKNIKNLEFINYLEMNLKEKQLNNMPLEFFTGLKELKQLSQNNILITLHSLDKFK